MTELICNPWVNDIAMLAQTKAGTVGRGVSLAQWIAVAVALAVLILPFVVGNYLARAIKMPNYGTRFGWILLAIVASSVVLSRSWPGLGVDLRGGTILVYEIDPVKLDTIDEVGGQRVTSEDLVEPLTRRINPSGTQEIVIRPYGDSQIEIIVPEVDQREVDRIKRKIEEAGILRFAILANRTDHDYSINLAIEQAQDPNRAIRTSEQVFDNNGKRVAFWANVDRERVNDELGPLRVDVLDAITRNPTTGEILQLPFTLRGPDSLAKTADWIDQQGMVGIETLMVFEEELDVTGEDLAFAASTFDQSGGPAVAFTLTDRGSGRFLSLTTLNQPVGSHKRQLGIVLDDNLLSAPNIDSPIKKEGRIVGRFTRPEVDHLVQILRAGQLPAALTKQPIAENQIDATLGADTIRKGVIAIGVSLILVLIFIFLYYRFAGIVACAALVANLAMILATMVLINQPLTLPGLAGLVLTVGMSVDANVLIFERIREELKKGAADRMAIRNGFAKATVTIIDANLTTLITAIVLYAIGTDQIRGFAVTLILGILFSMFTAIYVSRTIFDVAERYGFLSLRMSDGVNSIRTMLSGEGGLDFIGKGRVTVALSAVLIVVGIAAMAMRGRGIFDIDFAGGSSVQFRVDPPTSADQIREIVRPEMTSKKGDAVPFTVNGVSMDDSAPDTVYKVDSSFEAVDELKSAVARAFENSDIANLVTYKVTITPKGDASVSPRNRDNGTALTAARAQEDGEPTVELDVEQADDSTAPVETGDGPVGTGDGPVGTGDGPVGTGDGDDGAASPADVTVFSEAIIELAVNGGNGIATMNAETLREALVNAANDDGIPLAERVIELTPYGEGADQWKPESSLAFSRWEVKLPLAAAQADQIMSSITESMDSDPLWISSSSVGARVAGDMIGRAFGALFASLLCIIGYIWFRFQRVLYGFAAVAALLHDVLITLGAIAVSYWLAGVLGFLLIDPFKISLTVVAAILTIIGYSLNDTIVVFDRIRETKGKAPKLTGEMINTSINQTLSRTLLTSLTTLIVVVLLYWFGGEGIHAFAFALVVGIIAGTYSSVFIASPILLWLIQRSEKPKVA